MFATKPVGNRLTVVENGDADNGCFGTIPVGK